MLNKLKEGHWPIFILTSFSSVANLFLPIILTRLLSPEDIGIYKVFFLYLALLPFLFLTGGPLHSVYYWIGKKEFKNDYLVCAYQLTIILSALIIIVGVPFHGYFADVMGISPKNTLILLFVAFLWVPSSYYKELKIAQGATIYGSLFGTFMELIKVIIFVGMAYMGYSIDELFIAFLIFLVIKFLLTFFLGLKENINPFIFKIERL